METVAEDKIVHGLEVQQGAAHRVYVEFKVADTPKGDKLASACV